MGGETVREVYGEKDENYARVKAHRLLMKDNVNQEIVEVKETLKSALERKGITPEKIADTICELLDAKDQSGNKDYTAKDKGLKHALSIHGVEDPDKPKSNTTYNFIFNSETQEKIREINEAIKSKLIKGNV